MATAIDSICLYAGSSDGSNPKYRVAAQELGAELAREGLRLVYGGAAVGLMGVAANTTLAAGGQVAGVIPRRLAESEVAHTGLSELHVVDSMHERKALMAELADAFVALPGGLGTLEELIEVATWSQLGIHAKPCGLLNVDGYFDPLCEQLDRAAAEGFLARRHVQLILEAPDWRALLAQLRDWRPPRGKYG